MASLIWGLFSSPTPELPTTGKRTRSPSTPASIVAAWTTRGISSNRPIRTVSTTLHRHPNQTAAGYAWQGQAQCFTALWNEIGFLGLSRFAAVPRERRKQWFSGSGAVSGGWKHLCYLLKYRAGPARGSWGNTPEIYPWAASSLGLC